MMDQYLKFCVSIGFSSLLLQVLKGFLLQIFFYISLFSLRTLAWVCVLWFNLFGMVVSSYFSHALLDFSETCATFYLMHTLQVKCSNLDIAIARHTESIVIHSTMKLYRVALI